MIDMFHFTHFNIHCSCVYLFMYYVLFQLYLLQNFDLEHTDTFNSVFPWSMIEDSKKSSPGHQSSKLLQEKVYFVMI